MNCGEVKSSYYSTEKEGRTTRVTRARSRKRNEVQEVKWSFYSRE